MNAYYRWLPDGPTMPAYDEEHARGKVREAYPDAFFVRQADAQPRVLAWPDEPSYREQGPALAEIWWYI
jgi:hypothetical protein